MVLCSAASSAGGGAAAPISRLRRGDRRGVPAAAAKPPAAAPPMMTPAAYVSVPYSSALRSDSTCGQVWDRTIEDVAPRTVFSAFSMIVSYD